ncbi:MAG: ABC transporter substrate-binding protein [Anaerolineaceae bacterium]|nr:ABC transporter substrate-binding protein [Anaerolineaceae bacterium]
MSKHKFYPIITLLLVLCFVAVACAPATQAPVEEAPVEEAPVEEAPAAEYELMSLEAPDCEYGGNFKSVESLDELTVKFTLCASDPAFLPKIAVPAFPILDRDYIIEAGGDAAFINDNPIGTGPYMVQEWVRGDHITFVPNPNYWGAEVKNDPFILRWNTEAAARLLDLQSGNVDGIDNVGTDDYATVEADDNIQMYPRTFNNFLYLALNNQKPPFDNETVRQAIAIAIDKERIVSNFYPEGAAAATQFTPPGVVPGHNTDYSAPAFDPVKAVEMLESVGFDFDQEIVLSYGDATRPYFPQPAKIAQDVQAQLAEIGLNVKLETQEWAAYLPSVRAGEKTAYFLGWSEDFPDATNWYDVFLMGTSAANGEAWPDIMDEITKAARLADPAARQAHNDIVNQLVDQHVPYITIANGVTSLAFKNEVENVIIGPYNENYQEMVTPSGQFVFSQNTEPVSLDCADETDGNSFLACKQIFDTLYEFEWGTASTKPALAECVGNEDATEWTCSLRKGVLFSNGAKLDANDVVTTFLRMWDAENEYRVGNTGVFTYWKDFFGPVALNDTE